MEREEDVDCWAEREKLTKSVRKSKAFGGGKGTLWSRQMCEWLHLCYDPK